MEIVQADYYCNLKFMTKTARACLEQVDTVYNAYLPRLAELYVLGHRIADIEDLTTEQLELVADDDEKNQDKWLSWEKRRKASLCQEFQEIIGDMLLLKERKRRIVLDTWFLFNQILLETGVKLIFPQPRLSTFDEATTYQHSKILKEVMKEKGVPIITPENLEEVLTSGKLPTSFKKSYAAQQNLQDLNLDSRQSVTQSTVSKGFSAPKEVPTKLLQNENRGFKRFTPGRYKRSGSIGVVMEEEDETED